MRTMFALVFFILSGWRAYIDWQGTAGQGEDLALASTQAVWQGLSPGSLAQVVTWTRSVEALPELWDPGFVTLLSLPLAPLLLVVALFFFVIRRKPEPTRRGEMA